jgi:hypothetical protein
MDEAAANRGVGPFGNPEGSRALISNVMDEFVEFEDNAVSRDLTVDSHNLLRNRVIVGGKGTGKSVYLRRLQAMAIGRSASNGEIYSDKDSLFAGHVQHDVPTTESIVRVSNWYPREFQTEKWQWLWRRAILRSLVSHFLGEPKLRKAIDGPTVTELETRYAALYREYTRPVSIYSQLCEILNAHTSPGGLNNYLEHYAWNELEGALGEALHSCPAMSFYIDAIDDQFAKAPAYWLTCQRGLFHEVWRLLQDSTFGGRLHIIICIRDVVFSSLLSTEHADRYRDSPHIRMLTWDHQSLQLFLRAKLERISRERYFLGDVESANGDLVAAWLGVDTICNTSRGRPYVEHIEDYLLRHIRPLPRDIVVLGNRLCEATEKAKEAKARRLSPDWIKQEVSKTARQFGDLQLRICANQISADLHFPYSAEHGTVNSMTYADPIYEQLKHFIHEAIGRDRFSNAQCRKIEEAARQEFPSYKGLLSILWQNGLLGYGSGLEEGGDVTFYRLEDRAEQLSVPMDRDFYVLHSCLIDAAEVTSIGEPVFPYPPRLPYSDEV